MMPVSFDALYDGDWLNRTAAFQKPCSLAALLLEESATIACILIIPMGELPFSDKLVASYLSLLRLRTNKRGSQLFRGFMPTGICSVIVVFRPTCTAPVSTDPRSAPEWRTVHSLEAGCFPLMFYWLINRVGHPLQPLTLLSQKVEPFDMPFIHPGLPCPIQSLLHCFQGI